VGEKKVATTKYLARSISFKMGLSCSYSPPEAAWNSIISLFFADKFIFDFTDLTLFLPSHKCVLILALNMELNRMSPRIMGDKII